jgi:hypothetical protein
LVNDEEDRVRIIAASLENERRLIAAGKLERWDVVKWVVAANATLAGSSLLIKETCKFYDTISAVAAITTVAGFLMVVHYNSRMTGARRAARRLQHSVRLQNSNITSGKIGSY